MVGTPSGAHSRDLMLCPPYATISRRYVLGVAHLTEASSGMVSVPVVSNLV